MQSLKKSRNSPSGNADVQGKVGMDQPGAYDGPGPAWGEFNAWIASKGLRPGPESGPDHSTWRTERNRPLVG